MPIYDYLCSNCRHLTEVIHGIHDAGPRFCPACGADGTMRKVLSSPTVHFKGSVWAKKDRSSSSASRTKASTSSSTGDGGSSEPSSSGEKGATSTEPTGKSAEASGSSED